jgi:hypothetical protein
VKTRREFLATAGVGLAGASLFAEIAKGENVVDRSCPTPDPIQEPAGMPPAFGTAKPAGPEVSVGTFLEAEKLVK